MTGQSIMSIAGWWTAWVYVLSLSLPMLLGSVAVLGENYKAIFDRWAREVVFEVNGLTVSRTDRDGLAGLRAIATRPAPVDGNVRVDVEELTARRGHDFDVAATGAVIHFERGAIEGVLHAVPGIGPDIRIGPDTRTRPTPPGDLGPRSFRLRLRSDKDGKSDVDLAMCTVTIVDEPPPGLIPVRFARDHHVVPLSELATLPINVVAESPVPHDVPLTFTLFREDEDGRHQVAESFTRVLPKAVPKTEFRLGDIFSQPELEKLGLLDDGRAGLDETYVLKLMAPAPLFPDGSRTCRITAENRIDPPETRIVFFDRDRRPIEWLDPQGYVAIRISNPLRNKSTHYVDVDGVRLPSDFVVPAGERQSGLVSLAGRNLGRCQGRRCDVQSNLGPGCCPGQDGCTAKVLCGEPVPGDYMLVVVNNERLHEADNRVVDEVRKILGDEAAKPYGGGAIIVNPSDEDILAPNGPGPDREKRFRPFAAEGHDVAEQFARVKEIVARKRDAAANRDLRAVVVWAERNLAAATGLGPVLDDSVHPISFVLPDADPSSSREVQRAVIPPGMPRSTVTVRASRQGELGPHLVNVIAEGNRGDGPR
jgi:hypothetical protein